MNEKDKLDHILNLIHCEFCDSGDPYKKDAFHYDWSCDYIKELIDRCKDDG